MTEPDPANGVNRLMALIDDDLYTRVDAANRACIIGWGLFFTVVHQVRALLTLHREDACAAAAPNRRTALEYAITLMWCVDQGDRVADIYNRKLLGDQIQLANTLRADGATWYPQEAYQVMAETVRVATAITSPDPNERLVKIENMLDGYGLMKEKAYYQVESRFVHATPTGVQMFFRDTGDAFALSQQPIHEELVQCQPFALMVLHAAMLAFNELLNGSPWSDDLQTLAAEHGLSTTLPTWRGQALA